MAGRDSAQESLPGVPSPANQQGASDESTLNHNVDHSGASLNNDRDAASLGGAHSNIPNGNGNAGHTMDAFDGGAFGGGFAAAQTGGIPYASSLSALSASLLNMGLPAFAALPVFIPRL